MDSVNSIESINSLTIEYIDPIQITGITPSAVLMYFQPFEESKIHIKGTNFKIGGPSGHQTLYILMAGILQSIELSEITDSEFDIRLPKINPGTSFTDLKISFNKNDFTTLTISSTIEIKLCLKGYYCDLSSAIICKPGETCPQNYIA